jgi:hypothetical protein
MNTKVLGLVTTILLAGPMTAGAQSVVYDYTGVVTSSLLFVGSGSEPFTPVPIGTQVSGTYTLDYSQGEPQGGGKVGSPEWGLNDGNRTGSPLFSTTFRAGQVVYSTDNSLPGNSNVSGEYDRPPLFLQLRKSGTKVNRMRARNL